MQQSGSRPHNGRLPHSQIDTLRTDRRWCGQYWSATVKPSRSRLVAGSTDATLCAGCEGGGGVCRQFFPLGWPLRGRMIPS
jgi:hypothetical protein